MTSRSLRFGAAMLAAVAFTACKPETKPVADSAAAANATTSTQTTDSLSGTVPVAPTDSTKPKADSTKPMTDSAKPAPAEAKK
jgi:hypothetical protein